MHARELTNVIGLFLVVAAAVTKLLHGADIWVGYSVPLQIQAPATTASFLACIGLLGLVRLLQGLSVVEFLDWRRPLEVPVSASQAGQYRGLAVALTIVFMVSMIVYIDKRLREAQEESRKQHMCSESLLRNTLPTSIVERLKKRAGPIAERMSDVTVLFADIVGFTALARDMQPEQLVDLLNDLFSAFDTLAESLGLEKIKTIGDSYMLAGGVPTPREDHAHAVAEMGLGMRDIVAESADRVGHPLDVRIGIHTGDVIAGIIGRKRFAYDLWGETVNTAARMESHGLPGKIQISGSTMELIKDGFCVERRGSVEIKGMGTVETWLLEGQSGAVGTRHRTR